MHLFQHMRSGGGRQKGGITASFVYKSHFKMEFLGM